MSKGNPKSGRINKEIDPQLLAQKRGLHPDNLRELKETELQQVFDEKAGIKRRSSLKYWVGFGLLLSGLAVGAALFILATSNKPVVVSPTPAPTVDLTVALSNKVAADKANATNLFNAAVVIAGQCQKIEPCPDYPQALNKLTEAYNLNPDPAIAAQLKQSYLGYANQLFKTAQNADAFRLGLEELRKAKQLFPADVEIGNREVIADFYQQGWGKLSSEAFDEATGRFAAAWSGAKGKNIDPRGFYDLANKYYESLLKYADKLAAGNNPKEAAFHLRTALALNLSPEKNDQVNKKLKLLPPDA